MSSPQPSTFAEGLIELLPKLRRYARSLTRDPVRADDLVQDTAARALYKQDLWEPGSDLRAWLFTMLHNQHVNSVRRAVKQGEIYVGDDELARAEAPQGDPLSAIELAEMRQFFARLPRVQQRVLMLAALYGERYEQMAAYEMVPVGTVRSRLSRARAALRLLRHGVELETEELERLSVG